jgi:hypothetical protein
MAINRFFAPQVTEHTGQFFQLPYEMLAQPILKADEEYKKTRNMFDEYAQAYAAQEVLPEDMPYLEEQTNYLLDTENQLREAAGGDLLDPAYQQDLRTTIRSMANDNNLRIAKRNLATDKMYQESRQRFYEKNGAAPEPWQDVYGMQRRNYQGARESGVLEFIPIEARLDFPGYAIERLGPILQKRIQDGLLKRMPDGEGGFYFEDKE